MTGLAEIVAGWPLAASLALAVTARGWLVGRRRRSLNEALHELRRPLQALLLAADGEAAPPRLIGSAQLATAALERLDREINGGPLAARREPLLVRPLVEAAASRWKARARLAGGSLELRWEAAEAVLEADRFALAQALDNLIVNAIEHGGPRVRVEASVGDRCLRLAVADSGRASRPGWRRETPAEPIARLTGRRRHGHGLAVVRRAAVAHGGRFALRRSEQGSIALLELPLATEPPRRAA